MRLLRMARAWACYRAIGVIPRPWLDPLLPWAGDWIYRGECRAAGLDPWARREMCDGD